MPERNHKNAYGRNQVASMSDEESTGNLASGVVSVPEHCGFPKKPPLNDSPGCDSSGDFVPHIITRMPDLTGYGPGTAPQSISLYRPKHSRWRINLEIVKILSLRKWGALITITIVVTVFAWSLFRGSDAKQITQNTRSDITADNPPSDIAPQPGQLRPTTTQGLNEYQFDGFDTGSPASRATGDQGTTFNGSTAHSLPQNSYFGQQSMVQVDAPSRDLPPWERQPNNTMASSAQTSLQFDIPGNQQGSNGISRPNPNMMGNTPQNMNQQAAYQPNMQSQNGQNQYASQPLGFGGGMATEYGSPAPQNTTGTIAGTPPSNGGFNGGTVPYQSMMSDNRQPNPQQFVSDQQRYGSVSQQFDEGFGTSPQQVNYQQPPVGHDNAVAINTANAPSYSQYSQLQGQWPPQNTGNMLQNAEIQNSGGMNMIVPQPSYPGNGPQYTTQGPTQFAPQPAMSDVPMMTPGQLYPAPTAMTSPYSGNQQQQPFPYQNVAASPSQDYYYR